MLKANTRRLTNAELQSCIDLLMTYRIHIEDGFIRKPAGENTLQQYIFNVREIRTVTFVDLENKSVLTVHTDARKIMFDMPGSYGKVAAWETCETLLKLRDFYLGLCVATYSAHSYVQP